MQFDNLSSGEESLERSSLKVLHVASEAVPFAKVGGLADVVGSLPLALKDHGVDVRLLLPAYKSVKEGPFKLKTVVDPFYVYLGERPVEVSLLEAEDTPYPAYFLDCPEYYYREGIYGSDPANAFDDNLERYTLLSKSVIDFLPKLGWMPDLIHAHDWQTALIPSYMSHLRESQSPLSKMGTLYTIHNLAYQGDFTKEKRSLLGLFGKPFSWRKLKYFGKINLMKVGIVGADWVNTVSPGYRDETLRGGPTGAGMEVFLRNRKKEYSGIINGIDYNHWNPANDRYLAAQYQGDWNDFKLGNKRALVSECGLDPASADRPLVGMVTRIVHQKGVDVVLDCIEDIVTLGYNIVILGAGDRSYSERFKKASQDSPGNVFYDYRYNEPMAHRIYAGSDMFLMPSRFEPCGLSQMIAMHYGTIPVVHNVGGLKNTVEDFEPVSRLGTGFKFNALMPQMILSALQKASWAYRDKDGWERLVQNAVKEDFSWSKSASAYLNLYKKIVSIVQR